MCMDCAAWKFITKILVMGFFWRHMFFHYLLNMKIRIWRDPCGLLSSSIMVQGNLPIIQYWMLEWGKKSPILGKAERSRERFLVQYIICCPLDPYFYGFSSGNLYLSSPNNLFPVSSCLWQPWQITGKQQQKRNSAEW